MGGGAGANCEMELGKEVIMFETLLNRLSLSRCMHALRRRLWRALFEPRDTDAVAEGDWVYNYSLLLPQLYA